MTNVRHIKNDPAIGSGTTIATRREHERTIQSSMRYSVAYFLREFTTLHSTTRAVDVPNVPYIFKLQLRCANAYDMWSCAVCRSIPQKKNENGLLAHARDRHSNDFEAAADVQNQRRYRLQHCQSSEFAMNYMKQPVCARCLGLHLPRSAASLHKRQMLTNDDSAVAAPHILHDSDKSNRSTCIIALRSGPEATELSHKFYDAWITSGRLTFRKSETFLHDKLIDLRPISS